MIQTKAFGKVALWIFVIIPGNLIGIVIFLFVASFVVDLFKGWRAPNPKGSEISTLRQNASETIQKQINAIDLNGMAISYASADYDYCSKWYRNFDGASVSGRCQYFVERYYGFDGNLRQQLLALHNILTAAGWQTTKYESGLQQTVNDYYDRYYGTSAGYKLYDRRFTASDLREADYRQGNYILTLQFAEADINKYEQKSFGIQADVHSASAYYERNGLLSDYPALLRRITSEHTYVMAIKFHTTYFTYD